MIDRATAQAVLGDPHIDPRALAEVAETYPDLREAVAFHPGVYPALLDWLERRGDPSLTSAVHAARARLGGMPSTIPMTYLPALPVPPHGIGVQIPPGVAPAVPPQGPYPPTMPAPYAYPGAPSQSALAAGKAGVQKAFDSITGYQGEAIVRFRDLFKDTFKRHSSEDLDALMYAGTPAALEDRRWRLPWLYSRVFLVLIGTFLLLWVCMVIFSDSSGNVVPGVIFTGALVMPATLMIFFWEFNQAKNVSFFDVIRVFFLGGAMSILLTFIVSSITEAMQSATYGLGAFGALIQAVFIGFAEEVAKVVAVVILVRKLYGCLISNGLLVGAIVGTGFAVFETMGYGTSGWVYGDLELILFVRGLLSVGGHTVWAAIAGAALMVALPKDTRQFSLAKLNWGKFLALFCVPFALHTLWDFFAFTISSDFLFFTLAFGLVVIAWIFVVRLINSGLRQYAELVSFR